jgi:cytoskeletal protein CcmA (bactofilin family)
MWNRESAVKVDETKEPPAGPPQALALPADERRVVAWVGKSVLFTGTLVSSEDMTIDGRVDGTIEVRDHALTVGPNADIRADVMARVVTIHGAVAGNVCATFKVEIRETGRVQGNVTAPRILMVDGALVQGEISTAG